MKHVIKKLVVNIIQTGTTTCPLDKMASQLQDIGSLVNSDHNWTLVVKNTTNIV